MSRKVPEIPFPITFWPHALVQAGLAIAVAVGGWESKGFFSNLISIAGAAGPLGISILWIAFLLLVFEAVARRSQRFALGMFPGSDAAFRITAGVLATVMAYAVFVVFLAVLSRIMGTWQLAKWGHIPFYEICWRLLRAETPLLTVFAVGESLRQLMYAGAISRWRNAILLRRLPLPQDPE